MRDIGQLPIRYLSKVGPPARPEYDFAYRGT